MMTAIQRRKAERPSTTGEKLCKDLYALYESAMRSSNRAGDPNHIPDKLCSLRSPKVIGSRIRERRMASVKQALQLAVPEYEIVLKLLIQIVFSKFTGFPLCALVTSLTEDQQKEIVIREIVNIHEQVASDIVTDYSLAVDCICDPSTRKRFREVLTGCTQEEFRKVLKNYGMHTVPQEYIHYFETNAAGRYGLTIDHVRPLVIYFLIDPRWRSRKANFLQRLRERYASN